MARQEHWPLSSHSIYTYQDAHTQTHRRTPGAMHVHVHVRHRGYNDIKGGRTHRRAFFGLNVKPATQQSIITLSNIKDRCVCVCRTLKNAFSALSHRNRERTDALTINELTYTHECSLALSLAVTCTQTHVHTLPLTVLVFINL